MTMVGLVLGESVKLNFHVQAPPDLPSGSPLGYLELLRPGLDRQAIKELQKSHMLVFKTFQAKEESEGRPGDPEELAIAKERPP
jgi:hypothetical protein